MISWVEKGQLPEQAESRGKAREVLVARSMFDHTVFKMKDGVLMFTKADNKNQVGEVGRICIPASMVREVWSLCHQSDLGGHRGLEGTLLSARQKLRFLNGGCDTCIVKHFYIYGLPDQLHPDNSKEFVNNLWRELFSEFKIQHTTTPPYNPSSNPVECFHRTLISMLRTRGEGIQDIWVCGLMRQCSRITLQ